MEVLQRLIADRFGLAVTFDAGSIVYRETIADTVEGVGHFEPLRHYAEVHLLLQPGERGSGLQFETACPEDVLEGNWQRLILTHLEEKRHLGVLTGSPVTDLRITLVSGRAHEKHTEGGDFRQATYRAVRQGLMHARSVLLEPWFDFRLELPTSCVGRAMLWERLQLLCSGLICNAGAAFSLTSGKEEKGKSRLAVAAGCLGALALVAVLLPVLASADALFDAATRGLTTFLRQHLSTGLQKAGMGLLLTPFLFGLLHRMGHPQALKKPVQPKARTTDNMAVSPLTKKNRRRTSKKHIAFSLA